MIINSFGNDFISSAEILLKDDYISNYDSSIKHIFQRNIIHNAYYGAFHIAKDFAEKLSLSLHLKAFDDESSNVHTTLISFYLNLSQRISKDIKEREDFVFISSKLDSLRKKRNLCDYKFDGIKNIDFETKLSLKISKDIRDKVKKLCIWLDELEKKNS